jgi:hypothetical protein
MLALVVALYAALSVKRGMLFNGMRRVYRSETPTYFIAIVGGLAAFALLMLGLFATSL